jgi:hypothetical protein
VKIIFKRNVTGLNRRNITKKKYIWKRETGIDDTIRGNIIDI